ncbi:MAG: cell division protein [Chitinophagaceae bacterium]|nr:cell division protein [Chitinophagaceae bacterium]
MTYIEVNKVTVFQLHMALLTIETRINAPIERVFDLSRSIDLHRLSMAHTNETAIAGRMTGLIELNETVTWKAKHFGIYQTLTVKIIALDKPFSFIDTMQKGIFNSMHHTHSFSQKGMETIMLDRFEFSAPLGLLGKLTECFFLKNYMTKLLKERNLMIKRIAESDEWKKLL